MKLTEQEEAKKLYFQTSKTQKEIADAVGVSDRTIRTWIKEEAWHIMKQRALEMPSIIADNLCTMIITQQNNILERGGLATLEETQKMHKSILCLMKLKDYPSTGSMIQFMENFLDMSKGDPDTTFLQEATRRANHMLKAKNKQGFTPFQFEFGATPSYLTDKAEQKNTRLSSLDKEEYALQSKEGGGLNQTETKSIETDNTSPLGAVGNDTTIFSAQPEIPQQPTTQQIENEQTTSMFSEEPKLPQAELSGNLDSKFPLVNTCQDQTNCKQKSGKFNTTPLSLGEGSGERPKSRLNGRQPSTNITNKICLEWKGEGIVHDYSINKQRMITRSEFQVFLDHGYTIEELDNYQGPFDETIKPTPTEKEIQRQKIINNTLNEMKRTNTNRHIRRNNHW